MRRGVEAAFEAFRVRGSPFNAVLLLALQAI
jgi:hypothetical protein